MKSELIKWFFKNELKLVTKMQETYHGYLGIKNNPYHLEGSIWSHTKMVLDQTDKFSSIELVIIALLHDIGKVKVWKDNNITQRRSFTSHEAMSVFMSKPILEKLEKTYKFDKILVLETIAKHGSLYNYFDNGRINPKYFEKIAKSFKSKKSLEMIKNFFFCDHRGRIQEVSSVPSNLIINDFDKIIKMIDETKKETQEFSKQLIIMIGLPRSGKSTYIKNNYLRTQDVDIISRDNLIEDFGTGSTYSEKWKSFDKNGQKQIDLMLNKSFYKSIKLNKSIIIDMTNMSRKSRKKWLNDHKMKNYYKKCVLFIESKETVLSRMNDAKYISPEVINSMMCSFVYPNYNEFDCIEVIQ